MYIVLVLAVFATSFISGVLSMAGGLILMGVFSLLLPVSTAMVLHGVSQAISNGSRIWIHRRHIRWQVLPPYLIGALLCLGLFVGLAFVPSQALVLIAIGAFPFLALRLPRSLSLDMDRFPVAVVCGFTVTLAQLLAGASGPVLDVFYVKSGLNRYQVLGTKAITQTLGHVLKLAYYGFFIQDTVEVPWLVYLAVIASSIIGAHLATRIVDGISDAQFNRAGRFIVLLIGAFYLAQGMAALVKGS